MIPHQDIADALLEAYRTGQGVEPFTPRFPDATIEDAYRVQQAQVAAWVADGDEIVGHKVGLASRAMQQRRTCGRRRR